MEGMSCALMVGAQYVERIAACMELGLDVAKWLPPPKLDLGGLDRLMSIDVAR
jgi:hypothetical protein